MQPAIEVETRTLDEVHELMDMVKQGEAPGVTRIMLDNMAVSDPSKPGRPYITHKLKDSNTIFGPGDGLHDIYEIWVEFYSHSPSMLKAGSEIAIMLFRRECIHAVALIPNLGSVLPAGSSRKHLQSTLNEWEAF